MGRRYHKRTVLWWVQVCPPVTVSRSLLSSRSAFVSMKIYNWRSLTMHFHPCNRLGTSLPGAYLKKCQSTPYMTSRFAPRESVLITWSISIYSVQLKSVHSFTAHQHGTSASHFDRPPSFLLVGIFLSWFGSIVIFFTFELSFEDAEHNCNVFLVCQRCYYFFHLQVGLCWLLGNFRRCIPPHCHNPPSEVLVCCLIQVYLDDS